MSNVQQQQHMTIVAFSGNSISGFTFTFDLAKVNHVDRLNNDWPSDLLERAPDEIPRLKTDAGEARD